MSSFKRVKIVLHAIAYQTRALSRLARLACLSRGFPARVAGQNTRVYMRVCALREEMTDLSVSYQMSYVSNGR